MNNLRSIKSFVLHQGRITKGQALGLKNLMPNYGINYSNTFIDLNQSFGRNNPKIIEIGSGMGFSTSIIAANNLDIDYLAIEVHSPGVGALLNQIDSKKLTNLKVIQHDACEIIKTMITDNSVYGFHIFFPDPWPKKRHHKRRLIQKDFIELLCDKLIYEGYIHIATDCNDYAFYISNLLNNQKRLINQNSFMTRPQNRPVTKFEERGLKLQHNIFDFIFKNV